MKQLTVRADVLGGHTHVHMWFGPAGDTTRAKIGTLIVGNDDWPDFADTLTSGPNVNLVFQEGDGR